MIAFIRKAFSSSGRGASRPKTADAASRAPDQLRIRAFRASAIRRSASFVRSVPRGGVRNTDSSSGSPTESNWWRLDNPPRAARQKLCAPDWLSIGQIPAPSSNASYLAFAWVMMLPGGTSRVSQTLPPIDEPLPIVTRPSTVAPA